MAVVERVERSHGDDAPVEPYVPTVVDGIVSAFDLFGVQSFRYCPNCSRPLGKTRPDAVTQGTGTRCDTVDKTTRRQPAAGRSTAARPTRRRPIGSSLRSSLPHWGHATPIRCLSLVDRARRSAVTQPLSAVRSRWHVPLLDIVPASVSRPHSTLAAVDHLGGLGGGRDPRGVWWMLSAATATVSSTPGGPLCRNRRDRAAPQAVHTRDSRPLAARPTPRATAVPSPRRPPPPHADRSAPCASRSTPPRPAQQRLHQQSSSNRQYRPLTCSGFEAPYSPTCGGGREGQPCPPAEKSSLMRARAWRR